MIVEYYMSKNLVTVARDTKIFDAVELMKEHDIHRLPIVENQKLLGLITEGTIQEALPSKATSLSIYEINYLLNQTTVADIMIPIEKLQVIEPSALLEDAIFEMRKYQVGVLPVLNEKQELVGIITNNDIFDAFLEITGYSQNGVRVSISVPEDHQGILADLARLFSDHHLNIIQIVVYRNTLSPTIVVHLASTAVDEINELLKQANFNVVSIIKIEN